MAGASASWYLGDVGCCQPSAWHRISKLPVGSAKLSWPCGDDAILALILAAHSKRREKLKPICCRRVTSSSKPIARSSPLSSRAPSVHRYRLARRRGAFSSARPSACHVVIFLGVGRAAAAAPCSMRHRWPVARRVHQAILGAARAVRPHEIVASWRDALRRRGEGR